MPESLTLRLVPACLGALVLIGCFGSEPDDSPYTLRRGEAFEAIQLEIEPDGTPLIMSQAEMYMAHNNPDPDNPEDDQVLVQNIRSILHRRSEGGWSATAFKNLQSRWNNFPTLIPDREGRFQAFLSDGGEIKRYVFGNGGWHRVAGTEWPRWLDHRGGDIASRNWNRHPGIAVAGSDLLFTVHSERGGSSVWAQEGKDRRVALADSGGLDPLAFHVGAGYRSLVSRAYVVKGDIRKGFTYAQELRYHRWAEGETRAERRILDTALSLGESFFAPFPGGTALFVASPDTLRIYSLDDSGRVDGRDILPLPEIGMAYFSILAPDPTGCLHGLGWLPDSGSWQGTVRFAHWNSCAPGAVDTLTVPKPDSARSYFSKQANLRIAPDGTPVAAVLMREVHPFDPSQSWSTPSFLYLAELKAGAWRLEKVDERRPDPTP